MTSLASRPLAALIPLAVAVLAAPALAQRGDGEMMRHGGCCETMRGGGMMGGGMQGGGMMQGMAGGPAGRPNEQWRRRVPLPSAGRSRLGSPAVIPRGAARAE